jgi:tRNA (cmo5U34)-methyltransferase
MKQKDKNRFHSRSMAQCYDKMCQLMVPGYDVMQDTLINILKFENLEKIVLLDLGAGSGILIEKVLKEFPDSTCYYIDYSDDFMTITQERLKNYRDRVTYIKSDFCDDWESEIKEKPNIVTSMSAIHHLSNKNKKRLYKKCYNILSENSWFFNIDEMKTINKDAYLRSLYYWINYAENQKIMIPEDLIDAYKGWIEKFEDCKKT